MTQTKTKTRTEWRGVAPFAAWLTELSEREQKPHICIHGDYDADGVTSTAILIKILRGMGFDSVSWYLPKRSDGYGLSLQTVEEIHSRGADVLITSDCGITSFEEVAYAKKLGMEVGIVDHHQPKEYPGVQSPGVVVPECSAIAHTIYEDSENCTCAAGLAYMIAENIPQAPDGGMDGLCQIAATGIVADVMDLSRKFNNEVVTDGVLVYQESLDGPNPVGCIGLGILARLCGITKNTMTADDGIAFKIAPSINAPGRIGDPEVALKLLLADKPEEANALAHLVKSKNDERRKISNVVLDEAMAMAKEENPLHRTVVLKKDTWPIGVLGLVAGRMSEELKKAVILCAPISKGTYVGSGRAPAGSDLYATLQNMSDRLVRWGGHPQACGITIEWDQFLLFKRFFEEELLITSEPARNYENHDIGDRDIAFAFSYPLKELANVDHQLEIEEKGPYGHGRPRTVVKINGVRMDHIRKVGQGGNTFSCTLVQDGATMKGISFGNGEWSDTLTESDCLDVWGVPKMNEWRGTLSVTFHITRWTYARKCDKSH